MINQASEPSVSQQCELVDLNRTGVLYTPCSVSEADFISIRPIDELHLKHPFYARGGSLCCSSRTAFEVGRAPRGDARVPHGIEGIYSRPPVFRREIR
jgi:putative transposase